MASTVHFFTCRACQCLWTHQSTLAHRRKCMRLPLLHQMTVTLSAALLHPPISGPPAPSPTHKPTHTPTPTARLTLTLILTPTPTPTNGTFSVLRSLCWDQVVPVAVAAASPPSISPSAAMEYPQPLCALPRAPWRSLLLAPPKAHQLISRPPP